MKFISLCVLAGALLCGCASSPVRITADNVRSTPLPYHRISALLESREQTTNAYPNGLQRDSVGSKLFIGSKFRQGNEVVYRTLIVTSTGIREVASYPDVWYDDQEHPMFRLEGGKEWYEGEGQSAKLVSKWDDAKYVLKGRYLKFRTRRFPASGVSWVPITFCFNFKSRLNRRKRFTSAERTM